MSRTGVRVITRLLAVSSTVSPKLGGRLAYEILSRPPRFRRPDREHKTYGSARYHEVPMGRHRLKVYEWGQGPTILLVHCWGGRATQLHQLIESITASGYRVVSFDGPAHGESAGRRTDMFDFAQAIATVAKFSGPLEGVVAHSFGAASTMIARERHGLQASRYALISMFRSCSWFLDAFRQFFSVRPDVMRHMVSGFDRRHGSVVDWNELDMRKLLARLSEPVLLVHDRDDQEIPFSHAVELAGAAPHARLVATDQLGHRRILRSPELVRAVSEFLQSDPALISRGRLT